MDQKLEYEEAGRVHRYFLNWRHAAFAGYFAVLYGVATLIEKVWEKPEALAAVLLLSGLIGPALFLIDVRTRQLYHAAVQAGRAAERGEQQRFSKAWTSHRSGCLAISRDRTASRFGLSTGLSPCCF